MKKTEKTSFVKISFVNLLLFLSTINLYQNSSCDSSNSCQIDTVKVSGDPIVAIGENTINSDNSITSSLAFSPVRTFLQFRSVGANTARELVGWQWKIHSPSPFPNYQTIYVAYEYQQSFDGEDIANALFAGTTLKFSGSLSPDRKPNELLADNFGLSRTFKGQVNFCPSIENHIIDFGYYFDLCDYLPGFFIRLHAPVAHTIWNLNACEKIEEQGSDFSACYVDFDTQEPIPAAKSIRQALSGVLFFGDMHTPWKGGRVDFTKRTRTGLADIDIIFGHNWIINFNEHVATFVQAILPTGPVTNNKYLFDPVVGNNGHFELGVGLTAHATLYKCFTSRLGIFFEGNLTHMFARKDCRVFDFNPSSGGAFSRYMLLKEYDNHVFTGRLISATDLSTRKVSTKIDIKGDASVKLTYQWCNFGFDLGYNIYGHTAETLEFSDQNCYFPNRKYAIKGVEPVCCFNHQIANVVSDNDSTATAEPAGAIRTAQDTNPDNCANFPEVGQSFVVTKQRNASAQPAATAFTAAPIRGAAETCDVCLDKLLTEPTPVADLTEDKFVIVDNKVPTKFQSTDDLNIYSGTAPSALTHKIFVHFDYTWYDDWGYNPQIGVGGEVEFDSGRSNETVDKASSLNQWGVWLKGNVSF